MSREKAKPVRTVAPIANARPHTVTPSGFDQAQEVAEKGSRADIVAALVRSPGRIEVVLRDASTRGARGVRAAARAQLSEVS